MSAYFDTLCMAMTVLGQDPRTIFIGQSVAYPGTAISNTLKGVPRDKKIEMPVTEDLQMGMAIGLSLQGYVPICIYPRFNFLLLATNQLVLHLDKLPLYSKYRPHVIIRTAVATDDPLDPGPQHLGDFSDAYRKMLKTISLHTLKSVQDITESYQYAINHNGSSILVEEAALY